MAINVQWDNQQKTRVLMEFETSWTWDELDDALEATDDLLGLVPHQVDIIIDLEGSNIPKDFMRAAKQIITNPDMDKRPNEGNRVVIGANQWMRKAYQTIQKTFTKRLEGREVLFANDLSHARGLLHNMRLAD